MSLLPSGAMARLGMEAEQLGHRGAEQVGVENADREPELREADGEIAGDGRLADAALAGGDRDDVLDAGQRFARPAVPTRRRLSACMGVTRRSAGDRARRFGGQRHDRARDARNRSDRRLGLGPHRLHRLGARGVDGDRRRRPCRREW